MTARPTAQTTPQPTGSATDHATGSPIGWMVGMLFGIGVTALMLWLAPIEEVRVRAFQAEHHDEIEQLLVDMHDQAKAMQRIPYGAIESLTTVDMLNTLREADMDFRRPYYDSEEINNAVVCQLDDFSLVKIGAAHNNNRGMSESSARDFHAPDTFEFHGLGYSKTLPTSTAALAYQDPSRAYADLKESRQLFNQLRGLEYLCIVRFGERFDPIIDDEFYTPGYQAAEVIIYNFQTKALLGGFSFEATNAGELKFEYAEGNSKDGTAALRLQELLDDNLETAFWVKLKQLVPNHQTDNSSTLTYEVDAPQQALRLHRALATSNQKPPAEIPSAPDQPAEQTP